MTARVLCLLVLFTTANTALAQPARFEVASVRPSPETDTPTTALGVRITSSQVRIASLLMKDYLSIAFNVSPTQIVGPDWIGEGALRRERHHPGGREPRRACRRCSRSCCASASR